MKMHINLLVFIYAFVSVSFVSSCSKKSLGLPEVETETITAITQTSAVCGGKIKPNDGSEITEKGVCWGTNISPTILDSHTFDGTGDASFVSTLTGLLPKTDYHVRAFSTNIYGTGYGNDITFRTLSSGPVGQIIADHTVVDKYDDIPQYYIDMVKKMWLSYAGESHSEGIRWGLASLESSYPACAVSVVESGIPKAYTTSNLRASRGTWGDLNNSSGWIYDYGEEDWFTSAAAIARTKAGITYCHDHSLEYAAFGFGWCYDFHQVFADYISATQQYVDYCATNGYNTKIFFSTAPIDDFLASGASGWQRAQENDSIRTYVAANSSRILFDFADILCYDNGSNKPNTATYDGHTFNTITSNNLNPIENWHFSEYGATRLAKAMWWMLARIAGWDGN